MSINRLFKSVEERGPICVGLDPNPLHMPKCLEDKPIYEKIFNYNKMIIDATKDLVACYKPQAAYYEADRKSVV